MSETSLTSSRELETNPGCEKTPKKKRVNIFYFFLLWPASERGTDGNIITRGPRGGTRV